jgi:adenine/guanine phosphoribosyltransferase-like PRPP-binding protein
MPAAQLREAESFVAVSVGLEDLGLSRSDARTLSQTVLTELVENVAEHSGDGDRPPIALVGAILLPAENYARRQRGMHLHMAEVAERALADGSYVLRLIVADSGTDLAARLAPGHGQRGIGNDSARDRRRQEMILDTLGNRSAGAVRKAGRRRSTTGLWWVARVVRSYHGAVEARTADLLAGLAFGREDDGTRVAEAGFSYVPGTLLELTLPTGPSPRRPRRPWGSLSVSGAPPNLLWVSCAFDPQRGLADADRTRLADQMRVPYPGREADGLVVTVPLHGVGHVEIDDRWRGAIYQLLEFASSIARWGTVVVAFPDAGPHMLDPCVAAFNEELGTASDEDAHDPVLVVGRYGEPAWCGGSVSLRAVLTLLSQREGGVVSIAEAQECWQWAEGEPSRLTGVLNAHEHLLSIGAERLQLRLSLSALHETFARAVSKQLAEAISQGGEGVECGTFRGPTLRLTSRWIRVEELLAGTVGVQLAAFVLARKVESALRVSSESATRVVQVGSAPRPLARHLSECLTLGGRYYPQQPELNIDEPPVGEQVPAGAKVVLCADLISTANTVRRAIAMLVSRDADPLVIACVVDARATRGPVTLLNRTIPVVSLAEVEVGSAGSTNANVTDIDPLTVRPRVSAYAETLPAQKEDLLTWLAASDVLRLGHIDDPPRRHYSAFIKLDALREHEPRNKIADAALSKVKRALTEIRAQANHESDTETPIAIWYVASDGNAGRLAGIVHRHLVADRYQVRAVTQVPRWTTGDAWSFPASVGELTSPTGVLIIHWWAITGSTLLQLVRLAAKSGASWIAAVCVLNQLGEPNEADALGMLRAVSVSEAVAGSNSAWSSNDALRTSPVPVAIHFVADSNITAFDARGCPMCATRERYQLDEDAAPPRLINHAKLLGDMLRPRELEEVARDAAADLFSVPVTIEEAVDYLRWRGLLLQARRTVSGRQEVIDRLLALTGEKPPADEWTSDGLVRLLVAEQQWLRLPPLSFEMAADLLAQVCVNSFERVTAPSWLRVQALMVMSAAVPHRLVELLPRLLVGAGNEAVLIDQMLLDCCRLLLRPPGNLPINVLRLRHNLITCRDYLEEQRSEPDAMTAEEHLHAVRNLLTMAHYRILAKPKGPQAAWERLREDLVRPVVRHRLEAGLLLVRSFVEDIDRVEPSDEAAQVVEGDWDTCARQMEERALANLPPLREILDGDFASDWLGARDQRRLLTLAQPDLGELRAVTDRLHMLAHGPWRPADPSWRAMRRELLDRLNWWNRIFLAAHISDHEIPALLVELIRSAPVRLGPCVGKLLGAHQAQATTDGKDHGEVDVFCPEKLLDQIVAHLLENIDKHRAEEATCRLHVEYLPSGNKTVQMIVRNSGTVARTPPGRGLKALNDKLRPFGGSLTGKVVAEDEWTFAAVATLPLWHGE